LLRGTVLLRKTSLLDYPGMVSAVIFFPGCNLRCPWCHNRDLVLGAPRGDPESGGHPGAGLYLSLEDALARVEKRRRVLGGAALSGGEPTLHAGLGEVISRIKRMGLKVKLDTNGALPGVLENLLGGEETRPDYIAMDLKTAPERYKTLLPPGTGPEPGAALDPLWPGEAIKQSAALIRRSGIAHEFRSLALPGGYFTESDRAALAPLAGNSPWFIRPFAPGNLLDPEWDRYPVTGQGGSTNRVN
jgi:pyruvate formate lyase activating enzyme